MSTLLEFRLRVRNAADTADVLTVSSVRGDALPYISDVPSVDGSEFDPLTGAYRSGTATVRIADAITSGTSRVVTSQLEDATFRQQLPGRKAYVEERENGGTWNTVQAGIVTGLRLASGAVWEVDVGDTTMAGRNLAAFAPKRNAADATKVEPLADYLARWPNRGTMAGGPVLGGFLQRTDLGGWEMRVADRVVAQTVTTNGVTRTWRTAYLQFVAGYQAPLFPRTSKAEDVRDRLNQAMGDGAGDYLPSTFPDDLPDRSVWPDVVVEINGQYYAAASISNFPPKAPPENGFFFSNKRASGLFVWDSAQRLTVGSAIVRVRVYDAIPSERSPIYYSGHPVDLWTKLCDEAGLAYDATAAAACKAAIGAARRINLRITGPQSWSSFVESTLYGPCGFSARTDSTGRLVPFTTRIMASAAPSVTITSADVPQDETVLFDLSEPDAITKLTVHEQNLLTVLDSTFKDASLDGVVVQEVTVERTSGDVGAPVQREQSYSIPGFLDTGSNSYEPQLVDAIAAEIFDRDGRGRLTGELSMLRSGAGAGVVLGQEMIVALPQMPNHNKRLADDNTVGGRCVQIVRLSKTPRGPVVRFKDSGPNAQPAATLPTLVLGTDPGSVEAWVVVSNAATLNAAGIGVRLQWALTTGAAPAATDYSDVAAFAPGQIPTTAIRLPAVPAGRTAYVHGRSEQADHRPSAWTTPVSLAVAAMGAPTGLSVTPDGTDGSRATVAWTTGTNATAALTDIYLRLSTLTFADAIRVATGLLGGTISYPLSGLIPTDAYIVSVVHRDAVTGATTKAEFTFTAGSTTRTLNPPTNPHGIVGTTDPSTGVGHLDGTYGLDVTAVELPGYVTFWEAIETGIGTGTYGAFTQVSGMVPSVSGGPTSWRGVSANTLLRKQLKARHEAEASGANPSTYTSPVTLDAWGVVQSPPLVVGPSIDGSAVVSSGSVTLTWTSVGTLSLKVDGVTTSVPSSPYVVTRDGTNHTYDFLVTQDTQTFPWSVPIPRLDPPSGYTLTAVVGTATFGSPDQLTVTFSSSGFPTGTQFNVWFTVDATTTGNGTSGGLDNTTSGHVFNVGTFPSATPSGSITVDAVYNGQVIATKRRAGAFAL